MDHYVFVTILHYLHSFFLKCTSAINIHAVNAPEMEVKILKTPSIRLCNVRILSFWLRDSESEIPNKLCTRVLLEHERYLKLALLQFGVKWNIVITQRGKEVSVFTSATFETRAYKQVLKSHERHRLCDLVLHHIFSKMSFRTRNTALVLLLPCQ